MLFMAAVMKEHVWMRIAFASTMILVFGTVISAIWGESRIPRILATIAGSSAVLFGLVGHLIMSTLMTAHFSHLPGTPTDWMFIVSMISYVLFIGIAIFSIGRHIFLHDSVTSNVIAGGVCLYVLIGMCFAFIYATFALLTPGVFMVEGVAPSQLYLSDFFFFSYSTLTTAGFGGIIVKNEIVRVIAYIEAIIGSLYIAIMIAGLVGTYFAQRKSPQHRHS